MVGRVLLRNRDAPVQYRRRGVVVAWLRSSAARTCLRTVCVACSRFPLVGLSPIHAADFVRHPADVRNRTCALLYCPENPEYLARDHWPFVRKPVVFSRSCARRIPLLNRFPNV